MILNKIYAVEVNYKNKTFKVISILAFKIEKNADMNLKINY